MASLVDEREIGLADNSDAGWLAVKEY